MKVYDWQVDVMRRFTEGDPWCGAQHEIHQEDDHGGGFDVWVTCAEDGVIGPRRRFHPSRADYSDEIRWHVNEARARHDRKKAKEFIQALLDQAEEAVEDDEWRESVERRLATLERSGAMLGPIA